MKKIKTSNVKKANKKMCDTECSCCNKKMTTPALKSSVTALQEFCSKKKFPLPFYEFLDSSSNLYHCHVTVLDIEAVGCGRSKRNAKFHAAVKAIDILRKRNIEINYDMNLPCIENGEEINLDEVPIHTRDMVNVLRDYCVEKRHPLPVFELTNKVESKDNPSYTWSCKIATIKRFGTASNKKEARQKAAIEALSAIMISNGDCNFRSLLEIVPNDGPSTSKSAQEEERYHKFKTFHELNKNKGELEGVSLADRHNFFTKFHHTLKDAARKIIASEDYNSFEEKAMDLLKALKLKPKITKSKPVSSGKYSMLFIELDCEYDVAFANFENKIYKEIVDYFRVMIED